MTQNAVISDSNGYSLLASLKKSSITDNLVTHDVYTNFYYHKTEEKGKSCTDPNSKRIF